MRTDTLLSGFFYYRFYNRDNFLDETQSAPAHPFNAALDTAMTANSIAIADLVLHLVDCFDHYQLFHLQHLSLLCFTGS